MKGLITAVLSALLLCCSCSVYGESFTEHNLPATHHNSPLHVTWGESHLPGSVAERNVRKGSESNYKEQREHSGSSKPISGIFVGEEIEPSIIDGEPPRQRMMGHLGGLASDLPDDPSVADLSDDPSVADLSDDPIVADLSDDPSVSDLPCPPAAAILPCVCSYDSDYNIDLDCSLVESEEQLANVFQQEFPVKELRGFNMTTNGAIRVLDNILNGVTFRTVDFFPGPFVLEAISDYFFLGRTKRLTYFRINASPLTSSQFPFAILDEMTEMWYFSISNSQITWIPKIKLPNVTFMQMRGGLTDYIENGTFPLLADEYVLGLEVSLIERVEPGSFYYEDDNSKESNERILIDVSRNRLQTLEAGTVPMRNGYMFLRFYDNQISSVAPGAFVMPEETDNLSINLELNGNKLTTIDEEVYGELWPYLTTLHINGNKLTCGCDIAWIVTNPDYMAKVDPDATCADGTNLHNLDPAGYIALC